MCSSFPAWLIFRLATARCSIFCVSRKVEAVRLMLTFISCFTALCTWPCYQPWLSVEATRAAPLTIMSWPLYWWQVRCKFCSSKVCFGPPKKKSKNKTKNHKNVQICINNSFLFDVYALLFEFLPFFGTKNNHSHCILSVHIHSVQFLFLPSFPHNKNASVLGLCRKMRRSTTHTIFLLSSGMWALQSASTCLVRREWVVKRARGKGLDNRSWCTSTFLTPMVRMVRAGKEGKGGREGGRVRLEWIYLYCGCSSLPFSPPALPPALPSRSPVIFSSISLM